MDAYWNHCLTRKEMLLSGNRLEHVLFGYVVPALILFGIGGNILNLFVLLSTPIRNRSWLLSYLAMSDIVFLTFILPHSLANYDVFAFNQHFRRYYLTYKLNLIAVTNWASALAVWVILLICFERLIGVRYPLFARRYAIDGSLWRTAVMLCVLTMTGLLTAYTHISYDMIMKVFCNGTQLHAIPFAVDNPRWMSGSGLNRQWLRKFVLWNARVHEIFVVFIPTVVILIANVMLLIALKKRNNFLRTASHRPDPLATLARTEQNITYTVCAIVTCFTLTQAPSGFVSAMLGFRGVSSPGWKQDTTVVTNFMVVVGKSINFLLFCLSSATFRQRLIALIKSKFSSGSETTMLSPKTRFTTLGSNKFTHCETTAPLILGSKRSRIPPTSITITTRTSADAAFSVDELQRFICTR
ncbi:Putative G-protein coupled receptor F59B2.13 [Toxocara canis]|uniref:Putative G-protein coupled receptor F59B2.13 n=1 Tax=Toxocara canis TaxID=6265 RepID=A0A0B2V1Z9_TOXCA|nr:Putative G-protein coupled receptor F59B2.13 [Toxocara canis]